MGYALDAPTRATGMRMSDIRKAVCQHYGLPHLKTRSQAYEFSIPRQIAAYLCRELTTKSFAQIARGFRQHHSTAIHGYYKTIWRMEKDPDLRQRVESIKEDLA